MVELPRPAELDATDWRYTILKEKWCPDRDLNPGLRVENPRCWAVLHYRGLIVGPLFEIIKVVQKPSIINLENPLVRSDWSDLQSL